VGKTRQKAVINLFYRKIAAKTPKNALTLSGIGSKFFTTTVSKLGGPHGKEEVFVFG
jgi:hypothetical protein